MKPLADGLWMLGGLPPNVINIYLIGDVLVDAGARFDRRRILRQLEGRALSAHALTHAHADHQGASRAVCQARGVPLWCGEADAPAAEDPAVMTARMPRHVLTRFVVPWLAGPGQPVARTLREGDAIGEGFVALETPGHTAGHLSFWRESDRSLVLGDVLANMHVLFGFPGLHEPPRFFSADPAVNRDSARRVAALKPALVAFGHGPPLRDPDRLERFVAGLA
jgi:glyoxylase-like metal-dependent hydrolase (beta-lactamase superfamily II)